MNRKPYILVLNGPNMNMLGRRQPDIYGAMTLEQLNATLVAEFPDTAMEFFQSNIEGELVTALNAAADSSCLGVVLNAAAYTHTSVAIADAIAAMDTPVVEVHISNVAAREDFRRTSLIAPYCRGTIAGLGTASYSLAIRALLSLYK